MPGYNFTREQISNAFMNALAIQNIQDIVRRTQTGLSEGEAISFGVILERLIEPIIKILDGLDFGDPEDFKNIWRFPQAHSGNETLEKEEPNETA